MRAIIFALICAGVAPIAGASTAWAESNAKVALVIGVGAFEGGGLQPLRNPPNDARAVAAKLDALDFDVIERIDPDQGALLYALELFGQRAQGAEIGLIYYSGHGVENAGENYLFSAGRGPRRVSHLPLHAVTLSQMLEELEGVDGLRITILDACRDNTLIDQLTAAEYSPIKTAALRRGLTRPPPASGDTLIAYATGENDTASDGTGDHSPFTQALLDHLERPLEVRILFGHIRDATARATMWDQYPEVVSRMGAREYYFTSPAEKDPCDGVNYPDGWICMARDGEAFPEEVEPEFVVVPIPAVSPPREDPYADLSPAELGQKGYEAYLAEDYALAKSLYERAINGGDAWAMNDLGYLHHHALGVELDYAIAYSWYERAAKKGNAAAMTNLGNLYANGFGVEQDYAAARSWYEHAAEQGQADAMNNLGILYENGLGVEQDYAIAHSWYKHAAEKGQAAAMHNLGVLYSRGFGVDQDSAEAARQLMRALRKGNEFTRNQMKNNSSAWPRLTLSALQQQLRDAGVYTGAIDGDVGPATLAAIDAIFGQAE